MVPAVGNSSHRTEDSGNSSRRTPTERGEAVAASGMGRGSRDSSRRIPTERGGAAAANEMGRGSGGSSRRIPTERGGAVAASGMGLGSRDSSRRVPTERGRAAAANEMGRGSRGSDTGYSSCCLGTWADATGPWKGGTTGGSQMVAPENGDLASAADEYWGAARTAAASCMCLSSMGNVTQSSGLAVPHGCRGEGRSAANVGRISLGTVYWPALRIPMDVCEAAEERGGNCVTWISMGMAGHTHGGGYVPRAARARSSDNAAVAGLAAAGAARLVVTA